MPQESIYDIDHREYMVIESPIGFIRITGNDDYVFEITFVDKYKQFVSEPPKEVKKCAVQLQAYFSKARKTFDLALKPVGTDFQQSVWNELHQIPFGKTTTYARQAAKLGDLKAIRAVGTANGKNPIPIVIPCHRVIGSDGSMTGYAGGIDKKEWLLRHEGVILGTQMDMFL
jgi:methylated-DNA-[protein]-cysteine S-methyltransferase